MPTQHGRLRKKNDTSCIWCGCVIRNRAILNLNPSRLVEGLVMQLKKRNRLASKRAERNEIDRGQLMFKDMIADRLVSTKEGLVKFAKRKELLK